MKKILVVFSSLVFINALPLTPDDADLRLHPDVGLDVVSAHLHSENPRQLILKIGPNMKFKHN